jgi:AmmeMemoRadiSam system protein B
VNAIRPPAVAGTFYAADPAALAESVDGMLREAAPIRGAPPMAMIQPHAGHVYSGPIAAYGYRRLADSPGRPATVAVLGPNHTVPLETIALSGADTWETPLGEVAVDVPLRERLAGLTGVVVDDAPHRREHAVEVHLPFLQRVLDRGWTLLPAVVGEVEADTTAALVDALLAADTLVVVSSDLSHYLGYREARRRDERTVEAILARDVASVRRYDACGCHPIRGLLASRSLRSLTPEVLDLRNSGDTAGPRREVVGYASIVWV